MKKLLSFILILSLLLTFAFPVAQAGTLSKTVKTVSTKVQYITAGEFVTSLLLGAKVKPNGIADYWGKAVSMGLIPGEVKKDKPLTRAQASYIVWKLINAVPELKAKNIPVSIRRVPPTEAFMRGICFFGGPYSEKGMTGIKGYDLLDFIQGYQLLVMEYKYADGTSQIKYVWDRYKDVSLAPGSYKTWIGEGFERVFNDFKKKYPDKVVYAPRPYQKGWLFTIDPVRDGDLKYAWYLTVGKDFESEINKIREQKGYPLSRKDFAIVTYAYHNDHQEVFKGGLGTYNIKEHPYFNMYLEDYLVNYPRKYPTDHTRFAYYCKDYSSIPQLYREAMLHLADLGIITPDQSALYIGVYYFNPAKMLTRADAVEMISRVFDKGRRNVLDEVRVYESGYWDVKNIVGLGNYMLYNSEIKKHKISDSFDSWSVGIIKSSKQSVYRFEEPKIIFLAKALYKTFPAGYYGLGLALLTYSMGDYDLAGFGVVSPEGLHIGFKLYDEIEDKKLEIWNTDNPRKILLNFIPLAYQDEFLKDLNLYTIEKLKNVSKSYEVLKQYGNIYINFKLEPYYKKVIIYDLYTVIPQYKLTDKNYYPIFVAKPNPNYKQ